LEIDNFAPYFDGISIGTNDLTQLILGVDRDSELVAYDYDERDNGVKKMIQWAIEGAKEMACTVVFADKHPPIILIWHSFCRTRC
jgi:phosphoenolpyruvate synthase/pyruvate phosphate dikinase